MFFLKTIIICFLEVQHEWVDLKKESFFPKTKKSFLKTIENETKKKAFNKKINNPKCYYVQRMASGKSMKQNEYILITLPRR